MDNRDTAVYATRGLHELPHFADRNPASHPMQIESAARHILSAAEFSKLTTVDSSRNEAGVSVCFIRVGVARTRRRRSMPFVLRRLWQGWRRADSNAVVFPQRCDVADGLDPEVALFIGVGFELAGGHKSLSAN